jgi:hypothetical protein
VVRALAADDDMQGRGTGQPAVCEPHAVSVAAEYGRIGLQRYLAEFEQVLP